MNSDFPSGKVDFPKRRNNDDFLNLQKPNFNFEKKEKKMFNIECASMLNAPLEPLLSEIDNRKDQNYDQMTTV